MKYGVNVGSKDRDDSGEPRYWQQTCHKPLTLEAAEAEVARWAEKNPDIPVKMERVFWIVSVSVGYDHYRVRDEEGNDAFTEQRTAAELGQDAFNAWMLLYRCNFLSVLPRLNVESYFESALGNLSSD